jgi:predicted nucleic acid-binding protein
VLLLAKERGLVDRLAPLLADLQDAGLYLDAALMERVLVLAGEVA